VKGEDEMKLPESVRTAAKIAMRIVISVLALIGFNDVLARVKPYFGLEFHPTSLAASLLRPSFGRVSNPSRGRQ
jgi:hypothetical protein